MFMFISLLKSFITDQLEQKKEKRKSHYGRNGRCVTSSTMRRAAQSHNRDATCEN